MRFPRGNLYGLTYPMNRTAIARATAEALRSLSYGATRGFIRLIETVNRGPVAYRQAASTQEPVHRFEPTRHGPTASGLESLLIPLRELPVRLAEAALASPALPARSHR